MSITMSMGPGWSLLEYRRVQTRFSNFSRSLVTGHFVTENESSRVPASPGSALGRPRCTHSRFVREDSRYG